MLARIGGVQATLIRQDDQRIAFDQVGDQRAQRIVVAELDLVGDDRVVLVDDRHHAEAQQGQQRRARVQVALAVSQITMRQQHLRRADTVPRELRFVHLGQAHLSDGGSGLQLVDLLRPPGPAQPLHAFGDGAGAHQHDLLAGRAQRRDLRGPAGDGGLVEAAAVIGDQAGTDLDDEAARIGDQRTQGHGGRVSGDEVL
ncbi:hypothetical protein MAFF301069_06790 [Ralstonia pseudosolanacearum]|nr:hypothetical protein MAFF301069_06790 [Ralstonia pseudosolanacearum]